ncbi:uncharacterized protein LOC106671095 [Cimex lectularius]|uniref:THAP-type domain-containing protein n=1 Tax=Cimex lectularius TaxID=79782 RepID=A0A8I6S748_CIMLE|nr:uncharacterized protein LOC106671095 [Cimex lectularius]
MSGGKACGVAVCRNSYYTTRDKEEAVSYFRFPKDPKLRKLWVSACRRKDSINPETSCVCSDHFYPEDFVRDMRVELGFAKRKKRLRPGSVPSRRLILNKGLTNEQPTKPCTEGCAGADDDNFYPPSAFADKPTSDLSSASASNQSQEDYETLLVEHQRLKEEFDEFKKVASLEIKKLKLKLRRKNKHTDGRTRTILEKPFDNTIDLLPKLKKAQKDWNCVCHSLS